MDIDRLIKFLVQMRSQHGYGTLQSKERVLPGRTRLIGPYREGRLSYSDRYDGMEWFEGREEVKENRRLVWKREYQGGIIDEQHKERSAAAKLYDKVLKVALRQFPQNRPYKRGPGHLKIDDYEYFNICEGSLELFSNIERIFFRGHEAYFYRDTGGLVRI